VFRRTCGSVIIVFILAVLFISCERQKEKAGLPGQIIAGDSTTFFHNLPEFINPDTLYVPGDYPLPEVANARAVYLAAKQSLESAVEDSDAALSINAGEIAWTSYKDGGKPVLGYFRNYFGVLKFSKKGIERADLVIDVNSLDSAIPGRSNRILALFFESMKPEFGTAELKLSKFSFDEGSFRAAEHGKPQTVSASGSLTMNGVSREVTTSLLIVKTGKTWRVETARPLLLLISDFGFAARVFALMKECNHRSLGNAVQVNAKLYFR
jgi:polyisoprenoid-binding protein YceI